MKIMCSLFIFLAAVQSYAQWSVDSLKSMLDGGWEWVRTSGGIAGEQYTPQSVHYSLTLVFSKSEPQHESDSIAYRVYRSDTLILSGTAAIKGRTVDMPSFGPNGRISASVEEVSDTLFLGSRMISDGFYSVFTRQKTPLKKLVRGIVSDSATGAPIGNVKVVLMNLMGEIDVKIDSTTTDAAGGYKIEFSGPVAGDLYVYTISEHYYFRSMSINQSGIRDTIIHDIKLKRIPTMVSAAPHSNALQNITVRAVESRLYLSGMKTRADVDLYALNGRLLLRTNVPAGASVITVPRRLAATGCYQVSITTDNHRVHCMVLPR
jgi:hypothetical protein